MLTKHPWLSLLALRIAVVFVVLALVDLLYPAAGFFLSAVLALAASAVIGSMAEKRLGIDAESRRAAQGDGTGDGGTAEDGGARGEVVEGEVVEGEVVDGGVRRDGTAGGPEEPPAQDGDVRPRDDEGLGAHRAPR